MTYTLLALELLTTGRPRASPFFSRSLCFPICVKRGWACFQPWLPVGSGSAFTKYPGPGATLKDAFNWGEAQTWLFFKNGHQG